MTGLLIVTGGSRGIGAATALRAAQDGWDVCVGYRVQAAAADDVAAACREHGGRATALPVDVTEESDVERLFDRAEDAMGPVRGLVNNAGTSPHNPTSPTSPPIGSGRCSRSTPSGRSCVPGPPRAG